MEHQPIKNTPGFSRLESQLRSKLAVGGKRLLAGLPFGDRIPAVKAQAEKDFNDRFDKWYNGLSDERKERYHQLFETESSIYDPVQRENIVRREFSDMPGGPVEQTRMLALSFAAGGGSGGVVAKSASRLPRTYKALGRPPVKVSSKASNPLNKYMDNLRVTRPYRIQSSKLIESDSNANMNLYDEMWETLAKDRAAARAWVDQQHNWQSTIYPTVGKGAKSVGKAAVAVVKGTPGVAGAAAHKIGVPSRWIASKLFPLSPASSTFTTPDLLWASTTLGTVFGGGGYALSSLKDQAIDNDVAASKPEGTPPPTPIPGDQKVASNLVFQAYKDLSATGDTNTFMKTMQTVQGTDAEKSIMQRAKSNFFQTLYQGATLDMLEGAAHQTADSGLRDEFTKELDSFNKQFEELPLMEKYKLGGY
jgi:hypothetical protein